MNLRGRRSGDRRLTGNGDGPAVGREDDGHGRGAVAARELRASISKFCDFFFADLVFLFFLGQRISQFHFFF